jgi:hypothetical protein
MTKLLYASFAYLFVGLVSGLYFRELTKAHAGAATGQLGLVHTHLITLGFLVMLLVLALEKVFTLSASRGLFTWFMWLYNGGVIVTAAMMWVQGTLVVLGHQTSAAFSGIAGLGHMLITAGVILLFLALRRAVGRSQVASAQAS